MAYLNEQRDDHSPNVADNSSIELASDTHVRKRRSARGIEQFVSSSNGPANDKSSRRVSRKHRSPKPEQPAKFMPPAALQDDTRSFSPSLGQILEASPGVDSGRWDGMIGQKKVHHSHEVSRHERSGRAREKHLRHRTRGLMSPSTNSIMSTLTAATGSSSGSGSTVTQRSYDGMKKHETRHTSSSGTRHEQSGQLHGGQVESDSQKSPEELNVFKFMIAEEAEDDHIHDPDEPVWQSDSSSSDNDDPRLQRPYTPASSVTRESSESPNMSFKQIRAAPYMGESLHSDSGISMRGSSPECKDRVNTRRGPSLANQHAIQSYEATAHNPSAYMNHHWQRRYSNMSDYSGYQYAPPQPPPIYAVSSLMPYKQPQHDEERPPPVKTVPTPVEPASKGRSGYDLLASKLTSTAKQTSAGLTPVYRRFERLNHRIMLHLQDEIAELEEHLEGLDEAIARSASDNQTAPRPASRRQDTRCGGDLEYQRTELLGRIFLKIQQYNEAISTYGSLTRATGSAGPDDIAKYHGFLSEERPIVEEELRFLHHDSDLMAFKSASDAAATEGAAKPKQGASPPEDLHTFLVPFGMAVSVFMFCYIFSSVPARCLWVALVSLVCAKPMWKEDEVNNTEEQPLASSLRKAYFVSHAVMLLFMAAVIG